MPKSVRTIVIDAPPKKCFDVVWDFERYPEFISELKRVEIVERTPTGLRVEFTIKVIKEIKYVLDIAGTPSTDINWTLHKGFFKKNTGGWNFKSLGKGKTETTYELEVEFGLLVPPSVIKMLQDNNLPKMLEAVKKRVEAGAKKA
jgi:ribosome-associated toxin RatA of RatAB toxin-antitoxin module